MTRFILFYVAAAVICLLPGCGGGSNGSGSGGGGGGGTITETSPHPPIRSQYRRTDLQYNPNALQFFPPHITAYDRTHKRFFISNTTLNRVDVFDPSDESQVGSILVPDAWGMDVSPDGSKLYVATTLGDVYLIDPGAMKVVQRFASPNIGPQGYLATQVFILADGRLALLGAIGGFFFDGSPDFAIWDPVSNAITVFTDFGFGHIGQMAVTADRSEVIVAGATNQQVRLYDPSTDSAITKSFTGGNIEEILPTPDGKRIIVVGLGGNVEVFDANTLADLGSFSNVFGYSAVLSHDSSTLYTVDREANVLAWDTTTFSQKGWVTSFNVVDLQQAIVAGSIDENGLIFGPIGHGVAFIDGSKINKGNRGTQFNVGFLSPNVGPLSGSTTVQTEILTPIPPPNITTGTAYIGNAKAAKVSLSVNRFSGETPRAAKGGAADFTVVLPDGSVRMMPEGFSYGPTIVQVSPNAGSAEGGAQGAIFGYGFGQQTTDVQVRVGGQTASLTQLFVYASPTFPYPFPMQAVLFTVPPGVAGQSADIRVTTQNGSATAATAFRYIPAVQSFSLPGASLMQGILDPHRQVLYFTNRSQVEVFSPASETWRAPISLPLVNGNTRLLGLALSPDGNTMAVSDAGTARIYVLNPESPSTAKVFNVSQDFSGYQPCGLAVTDSGKVYYATFVTPGGSGFVAFHKLDTTNGGISDFSLIEDVGQNGDDAYIRVLLSPDQSRVYVNENGHAWILDTHNDSLKAGLQVTRDEGSVEMAISADGTALITANLLTDAGLDALSEVGYVDREVWLPFAVYGQKLSADGRLLYQPLTNGIDVLDGTTGLLQYRVVLPIQIANVYDALATDDPDSLLFAITPNGIAQLSLSVPPVAPQSKGLGLLSDSARPDPVRKKVISREWLRQPELRYRTRQKAAK
jgi:DNA-binding beta-propeller fold protein YncE